MRRLIFLLIVFSVVNAAYAQENEPDAESVNAAGADRVNTVPVPTAQVPVPLPPIVSGYSNSTVDRNGNVLIFDTSYIYPVPADPRIRVYSPPTTKTHLTVISADGKNKRGFDYDGSFQVAGVGRRGVYAIVSVFAAGVLSVPPPVSMPTPGTATTVAVVFPFPVRRLVALNVVAGTLPAPLPAIDPLGAADVKISIVGDDGAPDTIVLIESPLMPVPLAGATAPISSPSHSVRLFTFNGGTFAKINDTPISVP
jgi:hypothetical protein